MSGSFTRIAAVKAAAIMTLSTYVTIALGLVVSAVIARSLGPHDYGRYAYLLWITGLLISFGNHGVPVTATRFISELLGRQELPTAQSLHQWLLKVQWGSVLLVGALFGGSLFFSQPIGWEGQVLFFAGICLICFIPKSVYQLGTSVAKGYGAFWIEAWGNMIVSVIYTLGVVVLGVMKASLMANIWWFAGVCLMHLVIILPLLKKAQIKTSSAPLPTEWLVKIRGHLGWTSFQVFVASMSNRTFEIYLLSHLIGPAEVGYFSIAVALTRGGVELLSSSLATLLMPALAHAKGSGGLERVRRVVGDATRYFLFLGIFLAGVGVMWSAPGIQAMYGTQYQSVARVLQLMVLVSGLLLIDNPFSTLLLIIDDQRIRTGVSISFFALSALTAFALVPSFGMVGAVAANAIARSIMFGVTMAWVSRKVGFTPPWRDLSKIALAGVWAAAGAAGLVFISNHLLMQVLAGFVFAAILMWFSVRLNVWKEHDVRLLIMIAERKPNIFGRWLPGLERWRQRMEDLQPG
ncbi:MAG: hypothetical protein EOP38_01780 [Rubrivivax sp.]|nr:MAG: hypothetical protein EOP38_01780 [Rubrivivax sp.]